jgi:hypothetical protein
MLDLFAVAQSNASAVELAFAELIAPKDEAAARAEEFAQWIKANSLISINVKLWVVGDLVNNRPLLNAYELAEERARLTGLNSEELLRELLGVYYEKRTTFDRTFQGGEKLRYGALFMGGAGLTEYAPYCLVLSQQFQESLASAACVTGDSLKKCVGDDEKVDHDALVRNTAPFTHRHLLAATERAAILGTANRSAWVELVSGIDRYFEIIFIGDITLQAISSVSVLKKEYDRMVTLLLDSFGKKLDTAERALAHDFHVLLRGESEGKLRIEIVT